MESLQNNQEYVVIKAGTETLIKDGVPNIKVMKNIAKCIARLREKGIGVILVHPELWGMPCPLSQRVLAAHGRKKQALSALGQPDLIQDWRKRFKKYNIRCAQGLIEDHDFETDEGRQNMRRTIHELHELDDFWAEESKRKGRKSKESSPHSQW